MSLIVKYDAREQEVIRGRFGLDTGGDERTQREIAKELGISRSYVSRIEKRALMKLYHEFYKGKRGKFQEYADLSSAKGSVPPSFLERNAAL